MGLSIRFAADERCVYENVLQSAAIFCEEIFNTLLAILVETSAQSVVPLDTVLRLFRWIASECESDKQNDPSRWYSTTHIVENQTCEHGVRYKNLIDFDAFWDENRLRRLKDTQRGQHHFPFAFGVGPLLFEIMLEERKNAKEKRE